MTQPCDNCGNPSEAPTCDRCLGYQAWASDSGNPRPDSGKRHEQRVRDTRQHLGELPELYAQLALFILPGSTPQDPDGKRGKGNPAHGSIMNFAILDLLDTREKSNSDPTRTDAGLDSYVGNRREGAAKVLHKWALRVDGELWDDDQEHVPAPEDPYISGDCGFLLTHLTWIAASQAWFIELHDDVRKIWIDVRAGCGERDRAEYRPSCRYCRDLVEPVDTTHTKTNWQSFAYALCRGCGEKYEPGPELKALGQIQKPQPLKEISAVVGIPLKTLYRWASMGIFDPAPESPKVPTLKSPALFDLSAVQQAARLARRSA